MLAATTVAPGFWDWSFDPPLVLVIDLAILYWLGDRRTVTPARARRERQWQRACFYGALAVLAIALSSPLEILSEQLFWAHMTQHVLLLVVAPPLLVLARPWIRLWRALPLDMRRSLAVASARARARAGCAGSTTCSGPRRWHSWRSAGCCSCGTCPHCSTRRFARRSCTRWSTRCSSRRR